MNASSTVAANTNSANGNGSSGGVKKLDSSGEAFKKVSAFIHWKRKKFRRGTQQNYRENVHFGVLFASAFFEELYVH